MVCRTIALPLSYNPIYFNLLLFLLRHRGHFPYSPTSAASQVLHQNFCFDARRDLMRLKCLIFIEIAVCFYAKCCSGHRSHLRSAKARTLLPESDLQFLSYYAGKTATDLLVCQRGDARELAAVAGALN